MSTKFPEIFAALTEPFDKEEVKVRSQTGRSMLYITARTAMNRLDNVLGPENWWDEYVPSENSVLCRMTIRLPDGSTLTKADAGGYAGMADSGDDDKSGYSDAFKRAAVKFGVGRYLYRDGVPGFYPGEVGDAGPPADPHPPTPTHRESPRDDRQSHAPPSNSGGNGQYGDRPPTTGKAMFAWCKKKEEEYQVGLIKYLNGWAKLQELPDRMVEWDGEAVADGYKEAMRKLATVGKTEGELPSGEEIDPRQFPQNNSGHGRGQYASPDQVVEYRTRLNEFVEDRNQQWLDEWTKDGGLTEGIKELLSPFQVTGHMLKWGLREGMLADVGVAYDSDTGKAVDSVSTVNAEKYVAILWHRHQGDFVAEAEEYALDQEDAARTDWKKKYGQQEEEVLEQGYRG